MNQQTGFTRYLFLILILLLADTITIAETPAANDQSDAEIESYLLKAVKDAEALGSKSPDLVIALDNLASFYKSKAMYKEAFPYYERSLNIRKKTPGPNHPSVAEGFNNLARLHQDMGKYDKAESLYWDAIKALDKLDDPEHPEMTRSLHSLVEVYRAQRKFDKAAELIAQIPIFYQIKGTAANGRYTSVGGDYKVAIPQLMKPGAKARDEEADSITQVIFTDDFGAFYRVISVNNDAGEFSYERVWSMFPEASDKQMLETVRGREMRFIDIEREGAEIVLKTMKSMKDGKIEWEEKKPDMVTANSVFQSHNRFYHVIAGVTVMMQMTEDRAIILAKERLEKFLVGLVIVSKTK